MLSKYNEFIDNNGSLAESETCEQTQPQAEELSENVYRSLPDGTVISAGSAVVALLGYTSEAALCAEANARRWFMHSGQGEALFDDVGVAGYAANRIVDLVDKQGEMKRVVANFRELRGEHSEVVVYMGTFYKIRGFRSAPFQGEPVELNGTIDSGERIVAAREQGI